MALHWTRRGGRFIASDGPFFAIVAKTRRGKWGVSVEKVGGAVPKSGNRLLVRRADLASKDEAMRLAKDILGKESRG